jgi:hypothetical protein
MPFFIASEEQMEEINVLLLLDYEFSILIDKIIHVSGCMEEASLSTLISLMT